MGTNDARIGPPPTFVTLAIDYMATGEGHTRIIVIAPSRAMAEKVVSQIGDDFFLGGGAKVYEGFPPGPLLKFIPQPVRNLARGVPGFQWVGRFHYNLS